MSVSTGLKFCNILIDVGILFLIIFTPLVFGSVDLWAVTIMRLAVGFIALVWFIQRYLEQVGKSLVGARSVSSLFPGIPLNIPLLLGFGLIILNTYFSVYRYATLWWMYQFLTYALLYLIVVSHLRTQRQLVGFVTVIVIVGSLEAFFGLIRYLQGATELLGHSILPGGVTGTFISRTHLAVYLEMIIPLAIGLVFLTYQLEKKFLLATLIAIMGTSLVLSLSRGGIISLLASLIFLAICMGIRRVDQRRVWILFALSLVILIYLSWVGITPVIERIERTLEGGYLDRSSLIRLTFWQNSFELLKEAPLLGRGLGTFQYVFLKYTPYVGESLRATHAESLYIELLIGTGILGLIFLLWVVKGIFQDALKEYFSPGENRIRLLILAALTSFLAFLIHGFVDFNLRVPANAFLLTLVLAILMSSLRLMRSQKRKKGEKEEGEHRRLEKQMSRFPLFYPSTLLLLTEIFLILTFMFLVLKSYIAEVYFQQAQGYRQEGQWGQALEAYRKAIRLEGGNVGYYSELGTAYMQVAENSEAWNKNYEWENRKREGWKIGNWFFGSPISGFAHFPTPESMIEKALEIHARSVVLNPAEPICHVNLGWAYAKLGNHLEAAAEFEKAVSLYPSHPYYHQNLARYSLSQGNLDRGISAYQQALMLDIKDFSRVFNECLLYGKQYILCEQIVPDTPKARLEFARFLVRKKLWSEAEAEYEKILRLSQGDPAYYEEFAKFYTRRRKHSKAISLWRRLLEKDPQNLTVRFQIAQTYRALKNWEEALREYQRIIGLKPENIEAWRGMGDVLVQMKQLEHAVEAYKKALALMPQQPELYGLLGKIHAQMGNLQQAAEAYQTAVGLERNERLYYEGLASIYHQMNNSVEAIATWNRYLDLNAHDATARYKLAEYQNQVGNWLEAIKEAKIAITLDSRNLSYRSFLANLYLNKGMVYEASQQWEAIVQMNPKDPRPRLQLAALYEKLSQFERARNEYQVVLKLQPGNRIAQQKVKTGNLKKQGGDLP